MKIKMSTKCEKELFELDNRNDREFLYALSKWFIEHTGNVNVSQQLNIIANSSSKESRSKWVSSTGR